MTAGTLRVLFASFFALTIHLAGGLGVAKDFNWRRVTGRSWENLFGRRQAKQASWESLFGRKKASQVRAVHDKDMKVRMVSNATTDPAAVTFAQSAPPVFDDKMAKISQMLYSFYMLASCSDLVTPMQRARSECKHCQAAGFHYTPGNLRIVKVFDWLNNADLVASVARIRPNVTGTGAPGRACAIAIRGTTTISNFFSNLNAMVVDVGFCMGCKVHNGWYQQWNLLRGDILRTLQQLGCKGQGVNELYLSGHSSGCAVSDIAAMDLQKLGYELKYSIGFDCPKPGNAIFAQAFDNTFPDKVFKVQVDTDPIKHLPPMWLGFRDVGYAVQYSHSNPQGYRLCGRGGTLCQADHRLRMGEPILEHVRMLHCAAPHADVWEDRIYMTCDAKCDRALMEPEWSFADAMDPSVWPYTTPALRRD